MKKGLSDDSSRELSSTQDLQARLTELESRVEFQDETVAQLSDQIARQQQAYFELTKKFDLLIQHLRAGVEDTPGADPREEPPPPHY